MNRFIPVALALAAATTSLASQATTIHATFSGAVQSQSATAFAVNDAISGEFFYDTASNSFLLFNIGGASVAPGFSSDAALTPDHYSAQYQAQVSPVLGGLVNSTFTLDLEGLNPWGASDAVALLGDAAALAGNLDTTLSSFGFYVGNADGTNVHQLSASIGNLSVSAVPEPATLPLALLGAAMLGLRLRRRVG